MPEIDFDNLVFDYDKMTAKDLFDFEKATDGKNMQEVVELFQQGAINEKNFMTHLHEIVAFVWIAVRQSNPGITFEEVSELPMIPMMAGIGKANGVVAEQLKPMNATKPAARSRSAAKKATAGP